MTSPNKAIYIGPKNELFSTEYDDLYEPADNQGLIQVHYSGINPADLKHGIDFKMNDHVCGYEFSGKVVKAGTGFPYVVGDEIFGSKKIDLGSKFGAHQDWLLAEGNSLIAKRPSTLPKQAAAVMSIVVRTAADALFNVLGIPFAEIKASGMPTKSGILIWGGGSAVGWAAIQLAKAAGVSPIIITASSSRHQALKGLGATHCFDYRDDDVVAKIQSAIDQSGQPLKFIFDSVCTKGLASSTSRFDTINTAPDAIFTGTLPVRSDRNKWMWCLAARAWDMNLPPPIGPITANQEWESRLVEVVSWAAENYGERFQIPNLRVIEGFKEGIEAIKASGEGRIGFEKYMTHSAGVFGTPGFSLTSMRKKQMLQSRIVPTRCINGGEVLPTEILMDMSQLYKIDMPTCISRNSKETREPELVRFATQLRSQYNSVGAIRFCWGGWAVFNLGARSNNGFVNCISTAHPSLLEETEVEQVGAPVQILAPENDFMSSPEITAFVNRVIPSLGVAYDYQHFSGAEPWFGTRDEINSRECSAVVLAYGVIIDRFQLWLNQQQD